MKRFILLIGVLSMFSCVDDPNFIPEIDSSADVVVSKYAISADDALANLLNFMKADGDATRSADHRVVSSIKPVKLRRVASRSISEALDCENLLYVANFENEEGYAILAGDTRIGAEIIAVIDRGNLDPEILNNIIDLGDPLFPGDDGPLVFTDYPMTGPGFYTTPATGDEVFINPNTVDFYVAAKQDTLVGNFDITGLNVEPPARPPIDGGEPIVIPEAFTGSLCVAYAMGGIVDFDPNPRDDGDTIRVVTITTDWEVTSEHSAILADFASWKQSSPFNDLYPERNSGILFGDRQKAPAGCFPLAIAKTMTHFSHPHNLTFNNGLPILWNALRESYTTVSGSRSAAELLYGISQACDSWYFYQGTFTFPSEAVSYMRSIGFRNLDTYGYDFTRVKTAINNNCPPIIYAVPGINITKSHAWNLDGYKTYKRSVTTEVYGDNSGELIRYYTKFENRNMVHCDYGWGGSCNGYYVSGVFDLDGAYVEYDSGSGSNDNTHFNQYLHIITYDSPL